MEHRGEHTGHSTHTPIWLCLAIIGLAAWIYLSQTGAVDAANARLQVEQQTTQQLVARQEASWETLGTLQSPIAILAQARALGMQPGVWGDPNQGAQP